jgi:NAD(P)-dependent dehydrogenase (short-subunit alcohol dehydrogenase family)
MFKFKGRTAVISGGGEGIGLSIAKALGEQKMNIVLTDIDKTNLLKATAGIRIIRNSCNVCIVRCS